MVRLGPKAPLILVVSDDQSILRSVSAALLGDGLACRTLADPSRLTDSAADETPDLVLLDADIMGFDGRDLLSAWKRDARTTKIPVFFITGRERHWVRRAAFELGADEYLEKPLLLAGLGRRIRAHLGKAEPSASPAITDGAIPIGAAIDRR